MGRKKSLFKKIGLFTAVLLFVLTFAAQQFSPTTKAAETKASVELRAQLWQLISYMRTHQGIVMPKVITQANLNAGKYLMKWEADSTDVELGEECDEGDGDIGFTIEPDDGQMNCEEINAAFAGIITSFKMDPQKFYYSIGYEKNLGKVEGVGMEDLVYLGDDWKEPIEKLAAFAYLKEYGFDPANPSQDVFYYIYLTSFDTYGCEAVAKYPWDSYIKNRGGTIDDYLKNDKEDSTEDLNGDGKTETYYVYPAYTSSGELTAFFSPNKGGQSIGYGAISGGFNNTNINVNDDGRESCREMANWLYNNKTAATAYATTVAAQTSNPGDYLGGADATNGSGGGTTAEDTAANSCEAKLGGLGWLICQITDAADSIINWAEKYLFEMLRVKPEAYGEGEIKANNPGGINQIKTAWSAIRIIASVLIVAIALFMVISNMLGADFLSAYTVKKVIPKLVIAVILIQLSWFIFTGLITLTNAIGDGVQELLYAPFGGTDNFNISKILGIFQTHNTDSTNALAGISWGAATISVFAVGIALVAGAFGAIGLALGGMAIGVIIAIMVVLFVLTIRLALILTLLVISPLALAAWILPNTQDLWKKWWSLFSKLLIMYALIVALLSAGKIVAYLIAQSQLTNGLLTFFVVIIAYFGPFFLVPSTFKFAGKMFGQLADGVNKFGQKASKASDSWLDKKKARSMYAQTKAAKETAKKRDAQIKWAGKAGAMPEGDAWHAKTRRGVKRYAYGYGYVKPWQRPGQGEKLIAAAQAAASKEQEAEDAERMDMLDSQQGIYGQKADFYIKTIQEGKDDGLVREAIKRVIRMGEIGRLDGEVLTNPAIGNRSDQARAELYKLMKYDLSFNGEVSKMRPDIGSATYEVYTDSDGKQAAKIKNLDGMYRYLAKASAEHAATNFDSTFYTKLISMDAAGNPIEPQLAPTFMTDDALEDMKDMQTHRALKTPARQFLNNPDSAAAVAAYKLAKQQYDNRRAEATRRGEAFTEVEPPQVLFRPAVSSPPAARTEVTDTGDISLRPGETLSPGGVIIPHGAGERLPAPEPPEDEIGPLPPFPG